MTISLWAQSAKIIVISEAVLGIALNVMLLILLCASEIGRSAKLYRISCIVTTVSSLYTSLLLLIAQDLCPIVVFLLIDGSVANVLYGSLLFYLPERINDLLAIAFFTQAHAVWQTISAPTIVQWMYLARSNSSSAARLLYAYTLPVLFYCNSWYYMRYVVPEESLRSEMVKSIFALHGTDLHDFHVYGYRMINENGVGFFDVMVYDATPSYISSYGLFTFSALKIRSHLRGYGSVASTKTTQMQQRFFRIQLAQVFLPLALLSPSVVIALVATVNGVSLANLSLLVVYFLWLSPSATAFLLLIFVLKSMENRRKRISLSKVMQATADRRNNSDNADASTTKHAVI